MHEFDDLSALAGRRVTRIRSQLRANLIPPLLRALPSYRRGNLRADLGAAVSIAALTIPQAIAFALLTGLPVQAVLACAVIGSVVCSLYSSSPYLVFGPTNTISIILAGALLTLAGEPLTALQKVLVIGFLMGAIQLAAGLTNFGKLTQFVSRAVIIGYTTAVGILIATGQIGNLFGIPRGAEDGLPATLRHLALSFLNFNLNPATATVGLGSLLAILWLRRWRPAWPDGLPVLVVASVACAMLKLDQQGVRLVGELGGIAGGMPFITGFPLNVAGLALVPKVAAVAIAAAIMGMLEAVTIAKTLAARAGQRVDPDQELIGMGLGNLLGAVFGAMPGSASFLRSAASLQSGGQSQWAVIFGSGAVLLAILVCSPLLASIPVAAIAAYLIVIAVRLFQPAQILVVRRATSSDATVFWVTVLAALFLRLDTAIYTGIGVSLVLFLRKASQPSLVEHVFAPDGRLTRVDQSPERNHPRISIVHVEGDLFFGAADLFQDAIRRLAENPLVRVFILRLKNARHLDATTAMAIGQLHHFLHSQGRHLLISGTHGEVAAVLKRSGLEQQIGAGNIFPAEENPTLATKRALLRAQELLPGARLDVD